MVYISGDVANLHIQRFQSKVSRSLVDTPWFICNHTIHTDFQILYVKNEILIKFTHMTNAFMDTKMNIS